MEHICVICGHVHDETVEGLWDKLPDTFECPECGCSKEDYELLTL
jgi:rubredoxin